MLAKLNSWMFRNMAARRFAAKPEEAVAAVLGEQCPVPIRRVGVKDVFGHSGPAWELLEQFGLRSDAIIAAVKELV